MENKISLVDIKTIVRADYNPRTMPTEEMVALCASIEAWGFLEPVVINATDLRKNVLISGHQRLTALEKLLSGGKVPAGIEKSPTGAFLVPCVTLQLDPVSEKALNLAMNKISGRWDEDKLFGLISEINDSAVENITTGFSDSDIAGILDQGEQTSKSSETHSYKAECGRCMELKLQTLGHAKRSGHNVRFEENADK